MSKDTIKRIYRSRSDIENLSRLRTSISTETDTNDYKGIVVNKPWGYEYLMYENQFVAIWILFLNQNCATSMHCHPNKKTSYLVLSGAVICSHLEGWNERKEGEGLIIEEGVFHSTKATSRGGAIVMEIETPPNKKDLVRLKDEYGRENQGYEGLDKMSSSIDKYEYIDFHKLPLKKRIKRKLRNCYVSICPHENSNKIYQKIIREDGYIICMLQGKLHNDLTGKTVLSVGEVALLSEIKLNSRLVSLGELIHLTIHHI